MRVTNSPSLLPNAFPRMLVLLLLTSTVPLVQAQERYATISDCAITLVGEYDNVAAISAESTRGLLVQDTAAVEGIGTIALTTPFLATGSTLDSGSEKVTIGSSRDSRRSFTGETSSAVLYTGTQATAGGGDLVVSVAEGDGALVPISFVPGAPNSSCSEIRQESINFAGLTGILGGVGVDEQFVTVEDGVVTLNGTFAGLAGIEAVSASGRLSQQTVDIPDVGTISLTAPFGAGVTPFSSPNSIIIGILGAKNRLFIDQRTVSTSVLYSDTQEAALADLIVNVAVGDSGPYALPIGGEVGNADGTFQVDDGFLTLVGDFDRLSGIEATSEAGFLSVASELTAPFNSSEAVLVNETDGKSILLGVNTASGRVDLSGITQTAIHYAASDAVAFSDLSVRLGIAGQGAVPINHVNAVPEPNAGLLTSIALFCLLGVRKRR